MPLAIPRLRIPVFVSCPSNLNPSQEESATIILELLEKYKLQWRALGQSDYSQELPLREIVQMMKHCAGGLVLGFEQFRANGGTHRRGSLKEAQVSQPIILPTPWNQLEAGIMFSQGIPTMIFREPGIEGGIFDIGITDVFIQKMPTRSMATTELDVFDSVFQKWAAKVYTYYYGK